MGYSTHALSRAKQPHLHHHLTPLSQLHKSHKDQHPHAPLLGTHTATHTWARASERTTCAYHMSVSAYVVQHRPSSYNTSPSTPLSKPLQTHFHVTCEYIPDRSRYSLMSSYRDTSSSLYAFTRTVRGVSLVLLPGTANSSDSSSGDDRSLASMIRSGYDLRVRVSERATRHGTHAVQHAVSTQHH